MTIATGGTTAAVGDGFAPTPADEQQVLDRLYNGDRATAPDPTANPTVYNGDALRQPPDDATLGAVLYAHPVLTATLDRRLPELFVETGADSKARQDLRTLAFDIAQRTRLPEGDLVRIAEAAIDAHVTASRQTDPDVAVAALVTQIAEWNIETRAGLVDVYGQDAEVMLGRVQKFARAHPSLAEVLRQNGLGSNPAIVLGLAAHVHSIGYR